MEMSFSQKILTIALLLSITDKKTCANSSGHSNCSSSVSKDQSSGSSVVTDICQRSDLYGICIPGGKEGYMYIQAGFCLTVFNSSKSLIIAGLCPYFVTNVLWCRATPPLSVYYLFPANLSLTEVTDYTCGLYNREGRLCSKCKPGYGPAVYAFSLQCAKCGNNCIGNWFLYFFLVFFPITIFYFIIIIFNVRATAPPFTAFILMCQTYCIMEITNVPFKMKLSGFKYLLVPLQTVRMLCGFWNLDFFRFLVPPFCLSSNLNNLQALSLEYVHVIFPLLLILVTFVCIELHARNFILFTIIWKPFHKCTTRLRRSWDRTGSVINAFSTFLLLNFSKVITVTFYCFYNTSINTHQTGRISLIYFDPSVRRGSKHHLPYIICSLCFMILFVVLPTLLLCLYPTKVFRRLIETYLSVHLQNALFAFIDTFQGHYEDGTNETRDYRSVSALHLVVLALVIGTNFNSYERYIAIDVVYFILGSVALFYALARPCKQNYANILQSLLTALTAFIIMLISHIRFHSYSIFALLFLALICLLIPHVILGGYVIYKITRSIGVSHCHMRDKLCKCLSAITVHISTVINIRYCPVHDDNECTPLLNEMLQ